MAELADVRRARLARLVASRGFIRVTDAAEILAVSDVTIRGDLSALETLRQVVRVHGGAMPTSAIVEQELSLETTRDKDAAAKRVIGDAAAQLVSSGQSVYVDAGSTALALGLALIDRHELHELTVVTCSLTTALALEQAVPRFTVIVTGGTLRPLQHSLVSPFAAPMLDSLHLDWAFIGCNGVDPVAGVTNVNLAEAEIKTRVMARARHRVVMADGSKLGVVDLAVIAAVNGFETLVTAGPSSGDIVHAIRSTGIAVVTA